jgi:hypothetical protein
MLATMAPGLQKQFEHVDAYTMIQGLCGMFETKRYNISKTLFRCKLAEGSPVSPHVIKMMGYIETLDKLGCELKDDLTTYVILQSLPASYKPFTINFHMNGMEKSMTELHGILKTADDSIKKNPNHVMMVQKEKKKRKCWTPSKGKSKKKVSDEPSSSKPQTKCQYVPSSDEECFHYHKKGYWFRNCKKYLEEQKKKKKSETSTSCINAFNVKSKEGP